MNHEEEMKECLAKLKKSPVVNSEYYYFNVTKLCETIVTLVGCVCGKTENIDRCVKNGNLDGITRDTELIRERIWQIEAISLAIKSLMQTDDFDEIDDLFFHYKNLKEQKVDKAEV